MPQLRVVYVHHIRNTFIELDEQLLGRRYEVVPVLARVRSPRYLSELWRVLRHADLVVAWFASWHTLPAFALAALRGIPRILVTGGYDVAREPAIDYGMRRGGIPALVSGSVFRLTTLALPFSLSAYAESLRNTPLRPENTIPIPLGVPDEPRFQVPVPKEDVAVTVGAIHRTSVRRKGIGEFVRAARYLPQHRFVVVGRHLDRSIDELRNMATDNVEFTEFLSDDALSNLLQRASVYVQASHHEGFGLSVAQAMLARCVPVVTRRGSLPEIVADAGLYLDDTHPQTIAAAVRNAFRMQPNSGEAARRQIADHYSLQRRADALYEAVQRAWDSRRVTR